MSYFGMTFYRFFREMDRFDIKEANSAGSDGKESTCNAGDLGSIPGLERSPGEENGNPPQYSSLENFMERGTWHRLSPWGGKESGIHSVQFSSVAQSFPTLCDSMNCSMPGVPVHHQLPEFTQTHVHRVSDAIQPSHPLPFPSPLAPNPSQHQSLFQ